MTEAAWRDLRNPRKISGRIVGVLNEIQTWLLPNTIFSVIAPVSFPIDFKYSFMK
jgi:hypothetical protein